MRRPSAKRTGLGKPETFNFLGFTFRCGKSRCGNFLLKRKSQRDRTAAKLKEVKDELGRRMHQPIPLQGMWLRQVVTGFYGYHAVPTDFPALAAFRLHVARLWRRALRRRSQHDGAAQHSWGRTGLSAVDLQRLMRRLHGHFSRANFALTDSKDSAFRWFKSENFGLAMDVPTAIRYLGSVSRHYR